MHAQKWKWGARKNEAKVKKFRVKTAPAYIKGPLQAARRVARDTV